MQGCPDSQVLFDYLRQELPPDQMSFIEVHLARCADCRNEFHRLRRQIRQVQAMLAQLDPAHGPTPDPKQGFALSPGRPAVFPALFRLAAPFLAAIMLILGAILHLSGNQSALADSISKVKTSVDCSSRNISSGFHEMHRENP